MTTYCASCIADLALVREAVTAVGGTACCAAHAVLLTHPADNPGRRRSRLGQLRSLAEQKAASAPVEEQPGLELLVHEYTLAGAMDMGGQPRPDGAPRGDRPAGDRPAGDRPAGDRPGEPGSRASKRRGRGRGERPVREGGAAPSPAGDGGVAEGADGPGGSLVASGSPDLGTSVLPDSAARPEPAAPSPDAGQPGVDGSAADRGPEGPGSSADRGPEGSGSSADRGPEGPGSSADRGSEGSGSSLERPAGAAPLPAGPASAAAQRPAGE